MREPGKTLAHIEFTKDGRYALASVWEMDGAVVVFDAQTFKEVKRLPMSKPVGQVQRVEQDHAQRGHLALASLACVAGRTQRGWNTAAAVLRTRSSAAFCTWVDGRCKLVASDSAMRSGGVPMACAV